MTSRMGFEILSIVPSHAVAAGGLPRHHADPFDRMLVARAIVENMVLVSSDRDVARYDVRVLGDPRVQNLACSMITATEGRVGGCPPR